MSPFLRLLIGVVLVAALFAGLRWIDLAHHLTIDGMRSLLDSWGSLGPVVFVGLTAIALFASFPAAVLFTSSGMLFGSRLGFLYGWMAAMLGATLAFVTARTFARRAVQRSLGSRSAFQRLDARFEHSGFRTVLVLRTLLCVAPPLNWAMGATSVRSSHHFVATALGIIPEMLLINVFGASLAEAAQTDTYLTPGLLIPAGILVVVFAVAAVVGRRLLGEGR